MLLYRRQACHANLYACPSNHPGYIEEDAYIRPAASDLKVDEDYWVRHDGQAIRGTLQVPTKKLPTSTQMFSHLSQAQALESRRQCREKMEESGYLVRGRPVCSSNSPEHYRFVPISRFGNAGRSGKAEKNGSTELGVKVDEDTKTCDNTKVRDGVKV